MSKADDLFEVRDYYKNIDYSLWDDIFYVCKGKLENGSKDIRKQWSLELYSKYLQILEILCINILVVGTNNIGNLFISNKDLREDILGFLKDKELIDKFLDTAVFHIQQKDLIKNFKKRKSLYKRILNDSLEDYTKDYDFLNAYKHGFRLETKGKSKIALGKFFIAGYNTTLTYYSKEKDKEAGQEIIFKNTRAFNWECILYRSFFIIDILKKLKVSSSIITGEEVTLDILHITDEHQFNKKQGSFRWKEAIFFSDLPKGKKKIEI